MLNILGQDINVGSVVVRGGQSRTASVHRIGRVIKIDTAKEKVSVRWEFNLDSIPRHCGDNSRSSVSVHDVVLVPDESLDRIYKMWEASNYFTEHTKRPPHPNTSGMTYFSPQYKQAQKEFNDAVALWEADRKNYINNVLVRLGYAPMP